jgi:phosphate starvation-inducible protein PhoH
MANQGKVSKKQRRSSRLAETQIQNSGLDIIKINPLTMNQNRVFQQYDDDKHLLLTGTAGTGKTFLSLFLALDDVMHRKEQHSVTIIRSCVPSRDLGFLPGTEKQKSEVYEAPYRAMCTELFNRGDAYELLKTKRTINFVPTSFLRGTTFRDTIIVVDEIQNCNQQELHTVFTRIGENCRVIFCGDIKQKDLTKKYDASGFADFFKVLTSMKSFSSIEFTSSDIVRSALIKEYIIERENLELQGEIQPL